ncbi:MAG: ABC transporter substrate-binding protein [Pseudodesulfovibrio sp.]|nr:ABC transporter substrate-binding protein [Pseudodesulfovibrio sp.]
MQNSHHPIKTMITAMVLGLLLHAYPVAAMEKATIVLQWLPQAQFAGYYMAEDKGFYTAEGVDLTIIPGGPDILASEWLEAGKADFATMFLSTGLLKRETLPVINIGQFVQHSALMLITKKEAGINRLKDLEGKKVGLWANEFQIQPRILFKRLGIEVTVIPQSSSLDLFLRDGVQAASGMWFNEYHLLLSYGLDHNQLRPFFFRDTDLDFPEDGIYTLETTANTKPDLCRAVVSATANGWEYAFEHPEETLDAVMQRMIKNRIPANRAHQRWMLDRMKDIIMPENGPPIGVLRQKDFERVRTVLMETGFMDNAPMFPEFYRGPVR